MFTIAIKRIDSKHPLPSSDIFQVVATKTMIIPSDRAIQYATGLQLNFPENLKIRVENAKKRLLVLSSFLNDDKELILILMNIYHPENCDGTINEGDVIAFVSFYEYDTASVRFVEISDKGRMLGGSAEKIYEK